MQVIHGLSNSITLHHIEALQCKQIILTIPDTRHSDDNGPWVGYHAQATVPANECTHMLVDFAMNENVGRSRMPMVPKRDPRLVTD